MITTICVDNPATFPKLVEKEIANKQSTINTYLHQFNKHSNEEILRAFERSDFYYNEELEILLQQVKTILEDWLFEGFHNTRVLKKCDLIETGLQLLFPESYLSSMHSSLNQLGIDEFKISKACSLIEQYLDNNQEGRVENLSIFAPYSLNQRYWMYAKSIGGEVCENAISDYCSDVYSKLCSNGFPVTVKFVYPFRDIEDCRKETIALEFIKYYVARLFLNCNYAIEFDAILIKPVKSQDIIELIDFIDILQ